MIEVSPFRAILCAVLLMASAVSSSRGQEAPDEDAATSSRQEETVVALADQTGGASNPGHAAHNRDVFLQPNPETRTLTRDWFGFGDKLREHGVTTTLNFWITYQGNVTGGLSKDHAANGLYWFGNHFDLERLVGLPGGSAYFLVEGGWSEGINKSVGSIMNVNGTAIGDEPIGVTRLWYDQDLLGGRLRFRLGKIDVTTENFEFHGRSVAFDAMAYANTPRTQFLDSGLVNNASVPFPAAGLTGMLIAEPVERWYVAAAAFDRQSDSFDWSYSNAFDDWMVMAETGIVAPLRRCSLTGHYYVGYWYSTFPNAPDGQGLYLGVAQELYREPDSADQGLGVFARYGYGYRSVDGIQHYWSLGVQYQGLIPGREYDTLSMGWAQVFLSDSSATTASEGALELYYRARLTSWLHMSAHMQYIENPGTGDADDALTLGIRGQVTF
jgi:porin